MKQLCNQCRREMSEKYDPVGEPRKRRRVAEPVTNEPIVMSDEYQRLVNDVLQAKRRRELKMLFEA